MTVSGSFAAPRTIGTGFLKVADLAPVGDVTDDGRPDLVGRPATGGLQVYPGRGRDGLGAPVPINGVLDGRRSADLSDYTWVTRMADARGRGRPDLVASDAEGLLWLLPVTKDGVGPRRFLAEGMRAYRAAG